METSQHLFWDCAFAKNLWTWLASTVNIVIDTSSIDTVLNICKKFWSPQCKTVITAAIVNLIDVIWFCRNKVRFDNKIIHWKSASHMVISNTSLAGNHSSGSSFSDMHEFVILKAFSVTIHAPKAPRIKEVLWHPPIVSWIKCNIDGTAKGCPGPATCGGIFRDSNAAVVGCFAQNLHISTAFHAELIGAILAIELASKNGWISLWLETDSQLVSMAFKNHGLVPWRLRNRWLNCVELTKNMRFIISHIFREGNRCADKIASIGLQSNSFIWWDSIPCSVSDLFNWNRLGLPDYRFC
ncbi:hypothetical protein TSUD_55920 [Trifolium subterraneum]|uniref:RNase H type-1 domain-containing protein n=1 Tax=Trifolium subterraneum TaxID=3900 RepID=A0A2Z6M1E7_TRISU|nr:hypothetical protein TSUD_55920 [Trifolium subterraneum]